MKKFIRLNVTAEGQSEERFVKDTLSNHLGTFNISTDVRCVLTSKDRFKSYRGGLLSYNKAKKDIQTWIKEDNNKDVFFTTMFDLYALPKDFPRYNESLQIRDPYKRIAFLEKSFNEDINNYKFIPYLQLHEFEALLFTNIKMLELEYFNHEKSINSLAQLINNIGNPELIDDGSNTAPSKRIIKLIPEYEYDKVSVGSTIVNLIGIKDLLSCCQHFNSWIKKLESLSS